MANLDNRLYIVATPIGNLADFSYRAVEVLRSVDCIAAEDTRRARLLMQHYGIQNKLISVHDHNEEFKAPELVKQLISGGSIALISDAGTPLISDPGLPLVRLAKEAGIVVSPVPGACALVAALSASGVAVSRFSFEGFLGRTSSSRRALFTEKLNDSTTWVFYESSHRILACLHDLAAIFPAERKIAIAREMTKVYETIIYAPIHEVLSLVEDDKNMRKGEFVVIVESCTVKKVSEISAEQLRILTILLKKQTVKEAVALAVEITAGSKKLLYREALRITQAKSE
ncbi:MAG: 16S rRNA (cytidine(1402)-2'-O)-methyltransferase [Methylococcales bacterium]|nr:16S rRNA (cytidine(1402)-2'-O)-methyltransferase [Methylococcales bacterium]MBT4664005.1 16S rRNA (cytidine(1402)-2'-O)-methyltransferase [Methylococcales bacterium]MBT7576254.1 16S rRNA (cytidine(1402)-2'-O)-methyltransferase [Methylococcales bacterium]MDP7562350.1 16S rRNA (cytidine(1402)-2'-O)-methyltransferase [Methylococcales bacterium]